MREELDAPTFEAWNRILGDAVELTSCGLEPVRALDLGCGPGFFSIILGSHGCLVDAVDSSAEMLEEARRNTSLADVGQVSFHQGDVACLPFEDETFDLIVLRNVTWLMREPVAAYAEWQRVLKNEGRILVFDANWYRYLDEAVETNRPAYQMGQDVLEFSEESFATHEQEDRCEFLARSLPLTYEQRPDWDVCVLGELGFSEVRVHQEIWREVWTPGEQKFYSYAPLFMVEAVK